MRMRKVFWFCASLAVCTAVGVYLAADYVSHHPESMFSRAVVTLYRAGTVYNPLARLAREAWQRSASAATKPVSPTVAADQPTPEQVAQIQEACEPILKSQLPPISLLGTITIPDPIDAPMEVVTGFEEVSEPLPMVPLHPEGSAPLTMPYLNERNFDLFGLDAEPLFQGEECETSEAEMTPTVCPHHGCTQLMVCPYSGKCSEPFRVQTPCETTDEEIMKDFLGVEPAITSGQFKPGGYYEETSEPMPEEPKKDGEHTPYNGCEQGHPHGGYPRMVVCPYSGKCYPIDDDPCEPMTPPPMPELKLEEGQEAHPAEQAKPEKKKEMMKKRKVRHRLMLIEKDEATPKHKVDTLEFRPSDLMLNPFGVIPF